MVWVYTLSSVVLVSLISLICVFTLSWREEVLRKVLVVLVALAAGALFGDALIHLLPEIFEESENTLFSALGVLSGIIIFFSLEKFLHWRHSHNVLEDGDTHTHYAPLGMVSLVSDGFHNFLDGLIIGASFLVSPTIGFATTLAVVLHEIPQEIGDFAILVHAGYSRKRALLLNLLSSLLAIAGAVLALILGGAVGDISLFVLPLAAGGFLYLAGSDLVPELHKTTDPKKSLIQFSALIVGIMLMVLLAIFE